MTVLTCGRIPHVKSSHIMTFELVHCISLFKNKAALLQIHFKSCHTQCYLFKIHSYELFQQIMKRNEVKLVAAKCIKVQLRL